ncbi:MAG: carbohydrate-binding family 9-like protein [Armatimonadota bacterium]|nr:carbohydrate-binding family 9-like protein [Armatimonadota bacterium]MDW8026215.1 carbohydrate-binding family 9-like protein [Armatimonadota bacterium]
MKPIAKLGQQPKLLPFIYATEVPKGMAPNLDGKLDDAIWGSAQKVTLENQLGTDKPPKQATTAQAAYDNENIYIAFDCHEERMDLIRTVHKDPSGPVWQDDCVEVFIQPDVDKHWFYYFHAVVNPLGVGLDDYGYHSRWRCAAKRSEKGWTVEMAIPFATIGAKPPKQGECFGINFTREERPHGELSSWAPVKGHFHDSERFGRIVFGLANVRLKGIGLIEAQGEQRQLKQLTIALNSDIPIPAGAEVTISLAGQPFRLPLAQTNFLRYTIPTDLPAGPYRCGVRLTVPKQPTVETVIPIYHPGRGGLTSALWPVEVYNNTFYIANGQLAYFWLLVSDTNGRKQGYEAVIEVPEWMEILDPPSKKEHVNCPEIGAIKRDWTVRDGQRYRKVTIKVTSPPWGDSIDKVELWMQPLLLWFKAKVPKWLKLPHNTWLYTTVRRNNEAEPTRKILLVVLPAEIGRQPKRIPIYIWLHGPALPKTGWEEMLAHYQKLGVTGLQEGIHDARFDALAKKYGISTMRSFWWFWWAPEHLKRHPEDAAINAEGKPADLQLGMVCPEVLLSEGSKAFEEAFCNIIANEKGSPVGWNWDLEGPGVWHVCFCKRCMEAFGRFSSVKLQHRLDFETIYNNPKLRERWVDFALSQTERMVKKWAERIEKEHTKMGLYINSGPPVHDGVVTDGRLPWRKVLPYIKGGMFFRYCNSPIRSRTTLHQESVRSLEMVGDIGTPLWAMLSVGYNRVDAYNYHYPELTTLQMVQHVAIGYRGIHFWSYRGFDGRFNNAVARASCIIAKFEDWFLDGKRIELPKDALISPDMVLPIAWEYKGKLAIFLLNFDPVHDAKVRIMTARLPMKLQWFVNAITESHIPLNEPVSIPPLSIVVLEEK